MSSGRIWFALALVSLLTAGCATQPVADVQPGERPPLESEEAGFWMVMDRVEERVRTSGHVVRDEQLTAYVRDIFCQLTPDYCSDITAVRLTERSWL